jgi:hypothetical protein
MNKEQFGCHCELDVDQMPDACVMDSGINDNDCVHAIIFRNERKTKLECRYWREITPAYKKY